MVSINKKEKLLLTQAEIGAQRVCPFCGGYCEEDANNPYLHFCYRCYKTHNPDDYEIVIQ